eukprot:6140689-Alexandrium_andersonii.AAC.1
MCIRDSIPTGAEGACCGAGRSQRGGSNPKEEAQETAQDRPKLLAAPLKRRDATVVTHKWRLELLQKLHDRAINVVDTEVPHLGTSARLHGHAGLARR